MIWPLQRIPVPLGLRTYYYGTWWLILGVGALGGAWEVYSAHAQSLTGLLAACLWSAARIWLLGLLFQLMAWLLDYSEAL